ncbi:MAG: aminomethyl transferase family protein [Ardenticatenaceae bacterium]|nr:aminomethyl transferase family protein [Ardenticatenaceae bacterium]
MIKRSPFHPRLVESNETMFWDNWVGYASPTQYQYSTVFEYFSARNAVALFDSSPLFKYRIKGADATRFLSGVLVRDVAKCPVGRAQYTIWCNDAGFVLEDGVLLHVAEDEYWLTAAEPNLKHFSDLVGRQQVEISDISEEYGILAVQGPHSLAVLRQLTKGVAGLRYFGLTETKIAKKPVVVSRTGFTGDLGYEIWVKRDDALAVWDALREVGQGYNLTLMGSRALSMARIEAGLLLIGVDFASARFAWVDAQRETPQELGLGWMLKGLAGDKRPFIGRTAIEHAISHNTARWQTVGLMLDPAVYEEIHNRQGIIAPKADMLYQDTLYVYSDDYNVNANSEYVGYVTSLLFSPLLKRHIAIAKIASGVAAAGARVFVEMEVLHRSQYFPAQITRLPFYNPARKTAVVE